jgi:hypothetical protein
MKRNRWSLCSGFSNQEGKDNLAYIEAFREENLVPKAKALQYLLKDKEEFSHLRSDHKSDHLETAFSSPIYMPKFIVSERTINSEQFDLIQSDSIKQALLNLHNLIEISKEAYEPVMNQNIGESLMKNDILNLDVMLSFARSWDLELFEGIKPSEHEYDFDEILANEEVESTISFHLMLTSFMLGRFEGIENLTRRIIILIERQYNLH